MDPVLWLDPFLQQNITFVRTQSNSPSLFCVWRTVSHLKTCSIKAALSEKKLKHFGWQLHARLQYKTIRTALCAERHHQWKIQSVIVRAALLQLQQTFTLHLMSLTPQKRAEMFHPTRLKSKQIIQNICRSSMTEKVNSFHTLLFRVQPFCCVCNRLASP